MSTVDPDAARRARAARTPESRDLVLPGILALIGGGALAACTGSIAMTPGADAGLTAMLIVLVAVGSMVGGLCTVGGIILWTRLSIKNPRLPGWLTPIALALAGAAIGLLLATGRVETPAILLIAAVLLGIVAFVSGRRRAGRVDRETEIMRTGSPVTGEVTNQGYTRFGESSRILTAVTYAFTDVQGVRRYVQRTAVIEADDPIVNGEPVHVWFDPQNPSDDTRIVVRRWR